MSPSRTAQAFPDRTLLAFTRRTRLPQIATRAVIVAQKLLGLTFGLELAHRRNSREPLSQAIAEKKLFEALLATYQEITAILAQQLHKAFSHHRSQYSPELRFRILKLKNLLQWSDEETARQFRLSPVTIARWQREVEQAPEKQTVGSLVRPKPPVRRYADVVRELVQFMAASGFGGNRRIAQSLARAGFRMAKDTVRRIRREKPPRRTSGISSSLGRALRARYPGHIFMIDLTDIPGLFRILSFSLAVVFDVFSRMPSPPRSSSLRLPGPTSPRSSRKPLSDTDLRSIPFLTRESSSRQASSARPSSGSESSTAMARSARPAPSR